jgi:hypothetical protein
MRLEQRGVDPKQEEVARKAKHATCPSTSQLTMAMMKSMAAELQWRGRSDF